MFTQEKHPRKILDCAFSSVKYSLSLRKQDLIFDNKEYIYDMSKLSQPNICQYIYDISKLSQSNNANLILLNFCWIFLFYADHFQSWDETLLQQSFLPFQVLRWQNLPIGRHRELVKWGIFMQPQCVRSLDAPPWLSYNNFPEVNPSHKSGRHSSIFLLISHSQQDLMGFSGSTVSVWHKVCW